MKLLMEVLNQVETISENIDGKRQHYIVGPFMQAECKNGNGRWYPKPILQESTQKYIDKYVKGNRALGELNHPNRPNVDPERASHLIESLHWEGNNVIGKAKLLSTNIGTTVKNLLDDGVNLGVSSRSLGTTTKRTDGISLVDPNLEIKAIDIVTDPSGPNCFVESLMENVDWIFDVVSGNWVASEMLHEERKKLRTLTTSEISEAKSELFEKFLKSISA